MNLKIRDVAQLLDVSEKTVYRWIKEKKIPVYQINHQYRFDSTEIDEWVRGNRIEGPFSPPQEPEENEEEADLTELVQRGGIYYKIEGTTMPELVQNALGLMPAPSDLSRETILEAIMSRETLAPTSLGHGVALPHSRDPLVRSRREEAVAVCFLHTPFPYGPFDPEPVHTVIFPFLSDLQRHLSLLARIAFLCRDEAFLRLLREQAPRGEILAFLSERESEGSVQEK